MKYMPIDNLWPGEAAVAEEAVAAIVLRLSGGEQIEPVDILEIFNRTIVRNGNNRVRGWIEYYLGIEKPIPDIPCKLSDADPPSRTGMDAFYKISTYYGKGMDAFLKLPKVPKTRYEAVQTETLNMIYQQVPCNG